MSEESSYSEGLFEEQEFEEPEGPSEYREDIVRAEDIFSEFGKKKRTPEGRAIYLIITVLRDTFGIDEDIVGYIERIMKLENFQVYNPLLLVSAIIFVDEKRLLKKKDIAGFLQGMGEAINPLDLIRYVRLVKAQRV